MGIKTLLLVMFLGTCNAWAANTVEVHNRAYWLCKNQKEVRTIRVHVSGDGVCSTLYSKQGAEKIVGSGKNQESCLNFLNNIKGNLEKSNWACRDISATRITASAEEILSKKHL